MKIVSYKMPESMRQRLSKPFLYDKNLLLLRGPREYVASVLRTLLYDKLYNVYVVGDYTCETFVQHIGLPRMCIIDGTTLRESYDTKHLLRFFDSLYECSNPRGTISMDCINKIKLALKGSRSIIFVHGEEDLLALALLIILPSGYVIYGIPHEGVAITDVIDSKVEAINIFSHFQPLTLEFISRRSANI